METDPERVPEEGEDAESNDSENVEDESGDGEED